MMFEDATFDIAGASDFARQELWLPIRPNGSASETIEIDFPAPPKLYRLKGSLVQEGAAWFNNFGIYVGVAAINLG